MDILKHLETHIVSAKTINDEGVPSVSMALIDRSGALTTHVITNGKEDRDTVYQACSISKAITSLAVAKLVDDGRISYEDRIIDHLSQEYLQQLGKTEPLMDSVTVESLVSHRSGLSQHGFPGYSTPSLPKVEYIFLGRAPANTPRIRFTSFPFAQLSYSGGGYLLLQIFLEHVLGRPFHEILRTIVFEPLGMTRSTFTGLDASEQNYAKAFATAEVLGTTASHGYHSFVEMAAGGLWSTPNDMLKAVSAIQYSLHNDNGFLSNKAARLMLTKVAPNQPALSMAMGWGSDDQYFGHRGDNDPGYNCYVFGSHDGVVNSVASSAFDTASKDANVAFAIMTDSVLGFPVIQKIVSAIFHLDQWSPVKTLPGNFGSMSDFVAYPSSRTVPRDQSWKAWAGTWNDQWTLIEDGGTPKLRFRDQVNETCLFPAAEAGNNVDGSNATSFVSENPSIAVRLLQQDERKYLEIVQSESRQVMDRQRLI